MSNFKLLILAAGRGTRNQSIKGLHKGLLPLGNRAIISHIFDYVSKDTEIVIACGYKKEQLIGYVNYMHPDRKVTWISVDNWEDKGSGPGYSMLCCKKELQCQFVHVAIDTIIDVKRPFSDVMWDWIGCANIDEEDSKKYFLIDGDKTAEKLYYGTGTQAYIGIAGVRNYQKWWESLEALHKKVEDGEFQLTSAFSFLKKLDIVRFKWHDTGTIAGYKKISSKYKSIVAEKSDEAILFEGSRVAKYFSDTKKATEREERVKSLNGMVPEVKHICESMYGYEKVNGYLLSENRDLNTFNDFLEVCQNSLWKNIPQSETFKEDCNEMYLEKTMKRCDGFFGSPIDCVDNINGIHVYPAKKILKMIPWRKIYSKAIPSIFHGDLQPENVICIGGGFKLIDWRESFGKSNICGDRYYDLSKICHALLFSGKVLMNELFCVESDSDGKSANIEWNIRSNLLDFIECLKAFCLKYRYDYDIVEWISYSHYLAIAPMYKNKKYGEFLFLLGKYLLSRKILNNEISKNKK